MARRHGALLVLAALLSAGCDDDGPADAGAGSDAFQGGGGGGAGGGGDATRSPDASPGDAGARPDAAPGGDAGPRPDAATPPGAPPSIEIIYAPRRFPDCDQDCTAETLRFRTVDPDGTADLAGGRLELLPEGVQLAALPAETRSHEINLTWRTFRDAAPLDFEGANTARQLRIVIADRAGHTAEQVLDVSLVCTDGGPACGGRCAQGECFPGFRDCAGNRTCEYHPAPGGREGGWTCDATGAGRTDALCGPDLPCAPGFVCFRRDAVGCEGFAGGDGCCTPRCRPGMDDCPDRMACRPLSTDRPCDDQVGFCVYE